MTYLLKNALLFEEKLKKLAAPKEKVHRRSLAKKLEKIKSLYAKDKKEHDVLEAQHSNLSSRLQDAKSKCAEGRKSIQRLNSALYNADISDASDVIFHQESDDVSYIIDGKECHVTVDGESGEVAVSPWREYKKSKKELKQENQDGINSEQESEDSKNLGLDSEESEENLDESSVDDLYYDLVI